MARRPGDLRPKWLLVATLTGRGLTVERACAEAGIAPSSIRDMRNGSPADAAAYQAAHDEARAEWVAELAGKTLGKLGGIVDAVLADDASEARAVSGALDSITRHSESAWRREHDRRRLAIETRMADAKIAAIEAGNNPDALQVVIAAPDGSMWPAPKAQAPGDG